MCNHATWALSCDTACIYPSNNALAALSSQRSTAQLVESLEIGALWAVSQMCMEQILFRKCGPLQFETGRLHCRAHFVPLC